MTGSVKRTLALGGAVIGGTLAAAAFARGRWDRETRSLAARLEAEAEGPLEWFTLDQLEGLPEPVARYFRFALTPGQPLVRSACLEQRGEFRLGGPDSRWLHLTARQHFATRPPGFVWDASIRMAPGFPVRVRDSYLGGLGSMQGRMLGLVPVVNQQGAPELNAGALQRYLAEAP